MRTAFKLVEQPAQSSHSIIIGDVEYGDVRCLTAELWFTTINCAPGDKHRNFPLRGHGDTPREAILSAFIKTRNELERQLADLKTLQHRMFPMDADY